MRSIGKLLIPPLIISIIIRYRSILLIIFYFFLNLFLNRLTKLYHLVKYVGRYVQQFFGIISGNHYNLVNVSDGDFSVGRTAPLVEKYGEVTAKNTVIRNHRSGLFFYCAALSSRVVVFILLHQIPNKDPGIELIITIGPSLGRTHFRDYDH
jgi:hypothetical protein